MRGGGIGIFAVCSLSYLLGFLDLLVFDLLVLSVVVGGGGVQEPKSTIRGQHRVVFLFHFIPRMSSCFLFGISALGEGEWALTPGWVDLQFYP